MHIYCEVACIRFEFSVLAYWLTVFGVVVYLVFCLFCFCFVVCCGMGLLWWLLRLVVVLASSLIC